MKLLVFQFLQSTANGKFTSSIRAHVAPLDDTVPLDKMTFNQPVEIKTKEQFQVSSEGNMTFDDHKGELLFVNFSTTKGMNNDERIVRVWRIGNYLNLSSVEDTSLVFRSYAHQVSAIVLGNTVSIATTIGTARNSDDNLPYFSRKEADNKWVSTPIRSMDKMGNGSSGYFVQSPATSKYVHFIVCRNQDSEERVWHLYSIAKSNFAEAASNDAIVWRHYRVSPGNAYTNNPPGTLVVFDKISKKYRLYFFNSSEDGREDSLTVTWIPLRKDGSIESNDETIKCPPITKIPFQEWPSGATPRILEWNGKVLILVNYSTLQIVSGDIADDGSLPGPNGWHQHEVQFYTPPGSTGSKGGWHLAGAAVVEDDFVD